MQQFSQISAELRTTSSKKQHACRDALPTFPEELCQLCRLPRQHNKPRYAAMRGATSQQVWHSFSDAARIKSEEEEDVEDEEEEEKRCMLLRL